MPVLVEIGTEVNVGWLAIRERSSANPACRKPSVKFVLDVVFPADPIWRFFGLASNGT
jgi:hypothetical protein